MNNFDLSHKVDIAWCPGCGNFGILSALKMALDELGIDPKRTVLSSGIGQAAKTPQYIKAHYFNGLHGRSLPVAEGIKVSHPELTVLADSGDGDMYGEGGNHFLHAIRRNSDITTLVHNNMIYGLTKGQASPTTPKGLATPLQKGGVWQEPFNPIAVAIAQGISFVARANIGNLQHTKEMIKQAVLHKGFALVDIFQPCVVFNKVNTYMWYKEHTYVLDEAYDPYNRSEAIKVAWDEEKFALGIIYKNPQNLITFEEAVGVYAEDKKPLFQRYYKKEDLEKIVHRYY
ncbi:MAG: 2-oxoacid ferredoxin oxidoreductase [Candidatus Moranbacteria bacterium]|nr:2-oxoacid ferredoxin oxidoreductase [Candidatus Moranbacteria bacterium]